jgi:hypothetical protein
MCHGLMNVPEDLENLVNFRVAWEEWLLGTHLCKDATHGPHVDAGRVLAASEQNFWCTIPQSDDLVDISTE